MQSKPLTFRSSKVLYYGPHPCENCGVDIARMGTEFGGSAFTYPSGPIYPNTEWAPHVCSPSDVISRQAKEAKARVVKTFPMAFPYLLKNGHFVLLQYPLNPGQTIAKVASTVSNVYQTEEGAWIGADYRAQNGYPLSSLNLLTGNFTPTDLFLTGIV